MGDATITPAQKPPNPSYTARGSSRGGRGSRGGGSRGRRIPGSAPRDAATATATATATAAASSSLASTPTATASTPISAFMGSLANIPHPENQPTNHYHHHHHHRHQEEDEQKVEKDQEEEEEEDDDDDDDDDEEEEEEDDDDEEGHEEEAEHGTQLIQADNHTVGAAGGAAPLGAAIVDYTSAVVAGAANAAATVDPVIDSHTKSTMTQLVTYLAKELASFALRVMEAAETFEKHGSFPQVPDYMLKAHDMVKAKSVLHLNPGVTLKEHRRGAPTKTSQQQQEQQIQEAILPVESPPLDSYHMNTETNHKVEIHDQHDKPLPSSQVDAKKERKPRARKSHKVNDNTEKADDKDEQNEEQATETVMKKERKPRIKKSDKLQDKDSTLDEASSKKRKRSILNENEPNDEEQKAVTGTDALTEGVPESTEPQKTGKENKLQGKKSLDRYWMYCKYQKENLNISHKEATENWRALSNEEKYLWTENYASKAQEQHTPDKKDARSAPTAPVEQEEEEEKQKAAEKPSSKKQGEKKSMTKQQQDPQPLQVPVAIESAPASTPVTPPPIGTYIVPNGETQPNTAYEYHVQQVKRALGTNQQGAFKSWLNMPPGEKEALAKEFQEANEKKRKAPAMTPTNGMISDGFTTPKVVTEKRNHEHSSDHEHSSKKKKGITTPKVAASEERKPERANDREQPSKKKKKDKDKDKDKHMEKKKKDKKDSSKKDKKDSSKTEKKERKKRKSEIMQKELV